LRKQRDEEKMKEVEECKQKLAKAFDQISERKMDRIKGYCPMSGGRVGSHPSHDGYDDKRLLSATNVKGPYSTKLDIND
jgi:hypothetical protein